MENSDNEGLSLHSHLKKKNVDISDALVNNDGRIVSIYFSEKNYDYLKNNSDILFFVNSIRVGGEFLSRIFGYAIGRKIKRQSFDEGSLAPIVFSDCIRKKRRIFFVGGEEDEIELFVHKVLNKYNGLNVCGYINGYADEKVIIDKVQSNKPDVLVLSVGNVKQEILAAKMSQIVDSDIYTSGAYVSQEAMRLEGSYYPGWVNLYNLRWLYRIFNEKGHFIKLFKSYIKFFKSFSLVLINDWFNKGK